MGGPQKYTCEVLLWLLTAWLPYCSRGRRYCAGRACTAKIHTLNVCSATPVSLWARPASGIRICQQTLPQACLAISHSSLRPPADHTEVSDHVEIWADALCMCLQLAKVSTEMSYEEVCRAHVESLVAAAAAAAHQTALSTRVASWQAKVLCSARCSAAGTVLMRYVSQVHVVFAHQSALSTCVASWQAKVHPSTS